MDLVDEVYEDKERGGTERERDGEREVMVGVQVRV